MSNRFATVLRVSGGVQLLLLTATQPLWLGDCDFPAVPLLAMFRNVTPWMDSGLVVVFAVASAALVLTPDVASSRTGRGAAAAAVVSGILLCMINQHRLQPWNVLFLWVTATHTLLPLRPDTAAARITVVRVTVAMIYICSALSRFGTQIDDGNSRQILETLLDALGLVRLKHSQMFLWSACVGMSLVEFAAGVLLLTKRFRPVGICLAMSIHGILLLMLSPWGLNHNAAVLLWNIFFLIFLPVAFRQSRGDAPADDVPEDKPPLRMPLRAKVMLIVVVVFPLSGLTGVADNWPSWQLYSPRPEVLRVFIQFDAVHLLPATVRPFVDQPAPLDVWCPVRLDRWSLAATRAPIYPEDRFQLAVAESIAGHIEDPDMVRAVLDAPRQPLWWQRQQVTFTDAGEIHRAVLQFILNAVP